MQGGALGGVLGGALDGVMGGVLGRMQCGGTCLLIIRHLLSPRYPWN